MEEMVITAQWTVVLKEPEGLQFEVIEADTAGWGQNGRLEFSNMKAIEDIMKSLLSLMKKNVSEKELEQEVLKIIRAVGQMTVASFERESVAGFFKGLRANVSLQVDMKP